MNNEHFSKERKLVIQFYNTNFELESLKLQLQFSTSTEQNYLKKALAHLQNTAEIQKKLISRSVTSVMLIFALVARKPTVNVPSVCEG